MARRINGPGTGGGLAICRQGAIVTTTNRGKEESFWPQIYADYHRFFYKLSLLSKINRAQAQRRRGNTKKGQKPRRLHPILSVNSRIFELPKSCPIFAFPLENLFSASLRLQAWPRPFGLHCSCGRTCIGQECCPIKNSAGHSAFARASGCAELRRDESARQTKPPSLPMAEKI